MIVNVALIHVSYYRYGVKETIEWMNENL